jgi:WD40 repeat protein
MADSLPEDVQPADSAGVPNDQPTLADGRAGEPPRTPRRQADADDGASQPNQTMASTFPPPPVVGAAQLPLDRVGDYELLMEIARGGMGVVFQARHVHLNRVVALKMILGGLGGQLARDDDLQRFQTEAQAAAQLQHPGIVALFGVERHEGQPFISMEFVKGTSLAQLVARGPLPSRAAARYLEKTARAVHFAHSKGILHRDLKPANVLVDEHDEPKITDFGLAKLFKTDSGQTRTGAVIGTPSYMAPEQAAARKDLGPECDIYSLGAILYELLTGVPPFRGETALATLSLLAEQEPVAPRLLNPKVDADLETICLKCLEKEPARRYRDAEQLADDLRRYLDNEPISARRVGAIGRGLKWCRRKPAAAALLAVSAVATLALVVGGVVFGMIQRELRKEAEAQHREAERAHIQARNRAEVNRRLLYLAKILLAKHAWDAADIERTEATLNRWRPEDARTDLRAWEWYYLNDLCRGPFTLRGHSSAVTALVYRADGSRFATAGADRTIQIWETATGRLIRTLSKAHDKAVTSLAFLTDGTVLASAGEDGVVKLWDPGTGTLLGRLDSNKAAVTSICLNKQGDRLAAASQDGTVKIWNPRREAVLHTLKGHTGPVTCVVFSPEGDSLASAGRDGTVKLWDPAKGMVVKTLTGHKGEVLCLAFRHDGQVLASGGGLGRNYGEVRLWSPTTGKEIDRRYPHANRVQCLAFSREGKLAVAGQGGLVRVWDANLGTEALSFQGDPQNVLVLAFSANGRRLAVAGRAGVVRVWNMVGGPGERRLEGGPAVRLEAVAFSPDGKLLAAGGGTFGRAGDIEIWDLASRKILFTLPGHTDLVRSVAFSRDKGRLASSGDDGTIRVFDLKTRKQIALCRPPHKADQIAMSPDGTLIASAGHDLVHLWDAATGKEKAVLRGHANYVVAVAFSANGRLLASGSYDKTVRVWDVAGRRELQVLRGHTGTTNAVAFSPIGEQLVSGSADKTLRLWDLDTGKSYELEGSAGPVTTVAYSPGGHRIVCAGQDNKVHLWDVATITEILTLDVSPGPIRSIAFSPDKRHLACACGDNAVRYWEANRQE